MEYSSLPTKRERYDYAQLPLNEPISTSPKSRHPDEKSVATMLLPVQSDPDQTVTIEIFSYGELHLSVSTY